MHRTFAVFVSNTEVKSISFHLSIYTILIYIYIIIIVMIDQLLAMPQEVSRRILISWLTLIDVAFLDAAYCSQEVRSQFNSLAYGGISVYKTDVLPCDHGNINFLRWVVSRNVSLSSVALPKELEDLHDVRDLFFRRCGDKLNILHLNLSPNKLPLRASPCVPNIIADIGAFCTSLNELILVSVEQISANVLNWCLKNKTSLKHLSIMQSSISGSVGEVIAQCCPQLTYLNLYNTALGKTCLASIATSCTGLIHLDISYRHVQQDGLRAVVEHCKSLEHLNLEEAAVSDEDVIAVAEGLPQLTSLNVAFYERLTDAAIMAVAQYCKCLKQLNIVYCGQITDASIVALCTQRPTLTVLNMSYNAKLTDQSLHSIAEHATQLERLRFRGNRLFTQAAVEQVGRHCRQLQHVRFTLTSAVRKSAARAFGPLASVEFDEDGDEEYEEDYEEHQAGSFSGDSRA